METTSALLDLPFDMVLPELEHRIRDLGLELSDTADGKSAQMYYGTLTARPEGDFTRFDLASRDGAALLNLRDTLSWHLEQEGVKDRLIWAKKAGGARPANLVIGQVAAVTALSPSFRRVRVAGDFTRFRANALHFRILMGPEGADWPVSDDTGGTVWQGGIEAWHRPVYTIRAICPDATWIEFDVFLHDGGRVTGWTASLVVGQEIALTGPGGSGISAAPWLGLFGDETAMPVVIRMIEGAAEGAVGVAALLVASKADVQPVACPEGITLTWLFRDQGSSLLDALRAMVLPDGPRYVFFASEGSEAATAREIGAELGLGRKEMHAVAYWHR